jgi:methionyl-tRNA formyltransferase
LRVLFFGYSQLGFRAVELLVSAGYQVAAVVTHRDDPAESRWYRTPADAAEEHRLPLCYVEDLGSGSGSGQARQASRRAALGEIAARLAPDLVLSVFFRELLPGEVLAASRIAALNLHPSLLPAYRGRAPINWVLVNGEDTTGITLHHMVERADAGDIVAQRAVAIAPRETALSLYHKLEAEGVALLAETLPLVAAGRAARQPQDEARASYFGRRRPEDGRIDWSWPARRVDCLVRAVAPPWPGAIAEVEGRRVLIYQGQPAGPLSEAPSGRVPLSEAPRGRAPDIEPLDAAAVPDTALPLAPLPGTVRWEGDRLFVATADHWFEVQAASGIDLAPRRAADPADAIMAGPTKDGER